MEQNTFRDTMQGAIQGLTMARMMRNFQAPFMESAPGADLLAAMGINPLSMEIAAMLGEELQHAQDVPEQAKPFSQAMARVSELLNSQAQEQDDMTLEANNGFCGTSMPFAEEMFGELFSANGGIFGINVDALENALEELVEASHSNYGLERFSQMLWQELEPYMVASRDWKASYQESMEELRDMLLGLEELYEEAVWDEYDEQE